MNFFHYGELDHHQQNVIQTYKHKAANDYLALLIADSCSIGSEFMEMRQNCQKPTCSGLNMKKSHIVRISVLSLHLTLINNPTLKGPELNLDTNT